MTNLVFAAIILLFVGALIALPPAAALAVAESLGTLDRMEVRKAVKVRNFGICIIAVDVVLIAALYFLGSPS